MDYLFQAKKIFDIEIEAIEKMKNKLDSQFTKITNKIINCTGKVIITGIGKSGHIAKKISSTMSSLGTPSYFLHPGEALHGDLGTITKNDIVIAISNSGESQEILRLIPNIKLLGATLIGISSNEESTLIKNSDLFQLLPKVEEACNLKLAPTSSSTISLVYGDALAVVASQAYNFDKSNYGIYHPGGSLGKKLIIKVTDIMRSGNDNSFVKEGQNLKKVLVEMSSKGLGIVSIINNDKKISGVITDGDLRRQLEDGVDIYNQSVKNIMTVNPIIINGKTLAVDALNILNEKNISSAPVVDDQKRLIGTIRLRDIVDKGIFQ